MIIQEHTHFPFINGYPYAMALSVYKFFVGCDIPLDTYVKHVTSDSLIHDVHPILKHNDTSICINNNNMLFDIAPHPRLWRITAY